MTQTELTDLAPGHAAGELVTCAGCGRAKHRPASAPGDLVLRAAGWRSHPDGAWWCPAAACADAWREAVDAAAVARGEGVA